MHTLAHTNSRPVLVYFIVFVVYHLALFWLNHNRLIPQTYTHSHTHSFYSTPQQLFLLLLLLLFLLFFCSAQRLNLFFCGYGCYRYYDRNNCEALYLYLFKAKKTLKKTEEQEEEWVGNIRINEWHDLLLLFILSPFILTNCYATHVYIGFGTFIYQNI